MLKQRSDGLWRCSANASDVRPFWGRFFALYGVSLVTLALVTAFVSFGLMRLIGYPVSLRQIVWPPAWSEIAQVRSAYFIAKADRSSGEGNVRESLLSLYNAYELDPSNYAAGLRLARLWQVNQSQNSDLIYERLMRDHPEHRSETARLWLRALLARGDYTSVQYLASERLLNEQNSGSAWLHALVFATRHIDDPKSINDLLSAGDLPPAARTTLTLVSETWTLPPLEQRERLIKEVLNNKPDGYTSYVIGRRLLALGFADESLALTLRSGVPLANRERILLRLDSLAALGRKKDLLQIFTEVLKTDLSDTQVELLCTHLIRHPDPNLAAALFKSTATSENPNLVLRYETRLALFCVAGIIRDEKQLDICAGDLSALVGSKFKTLESVKKFFLKRTNGGHIEIVLPVLQPLSLEITYALLDFLEPN